MTISLMFVAEDQAQENPEYFHSVGKEKKDITVQDSILGDSVKADEVNSSDFSMLTIEELEMYIKKFEGMIGKATDKTTRLNNGRVLSYYTGEQHALTLENVAKVAEEEGLSNLLFVLAQAVLETGHFKSRACLEYNNLFGLYDSRRHDYYHFARWEDSVIAYKKFIQYRYKGGNYLKFLRRIGYAEDPGYTAKVAKVAMRLYDQTKSITTQYIDIRMYV